MINKKFYINLAGKKVSATNNLFKYLPPERNWFEGCDSSLFESDDFEDDFDEKERFSLKSEPNFSGLDQFAIENRDKILSGDELTWIKLYKKFYPYVYSVVSNNLYGHKSKDEIEDIVLYSFNTLYQKLGDWVEGTGLTNWLSTIAKNRCATVKSTKSNYEKKFDKSYSVDGEPDEDDPTSKVVQSVDKPRYKPDSYLQKKEFFDDIQKMLSELPEEHSKALSLFVFNGLSLKEIAEKLNWPLHKVKARLEDARKQARNWFFKNDEYGKLFKFVLDESKGSHTLMKVQSRFRDILAIKRLV